MMSTRTSQVWHCILLCILLLPLKQVSTLSPGSADAAPELATITQGQSSDRLCKTEFLGWYRQQPGAAQTGNIRVYSNDADFWDPEETIGKYRCYDSRTAQEQLMSVANAPVRGWYRMKCAEGYFMLIIYSFGFRVTQKVDCSLTIEQAEARLTPGTRDCQDLSIEGAPRNYLALKVTSGVRPFVSARVNSDYIPVRLSMPPSHMSLYLVGGPAIPLAQYTGSDRVTWDLPASREGDIYRVCAYNPPGGTNLRHQVTLTSGA